MTDGGTEPYLVVFARALDLLLMGPKSNIRVRAGDVRRQGQYLRPIIFCAEKERAEKVSGPFFGPCYLVKRGPQLAKRVLTPFRRPCNQEYTPMKRFLVLGGLALGAFCAVYALAKVGQLPPHAPPGMR